MPEMIKVVIINGDANGRKQISDTISYINDITVIGETESADKGLQMINDYNPDVTVIGEFVRGTDGFRLSDSIISRHPFHPIILVTSSVNEEIYRRAMRAGIKEILQLPLNQVDLSDAIYRVYDIKEKHKSSMAQLKKEPEIREKMGRIISVFSTKGGVGKTTISSNLAVLLGQTNQKVALLDLDVFSGDVALAMDITPKRSISDLVSDINKLDLDLLESYMFKHSSGVMVLPAPMKPEYADFVAADHITRILKILLREYDYIVVDCASYMHDPVLIALDASDIILLPTTMDIFSVKNLKSCISSLEGLNYSRAKFKVVVNRVFREAGISQKDIETTIGLPITVVLPQEDQVITASINQGVPAVLAYKKSKFARAMRDLTKKIAGNQKDTVLVAPQTNIEQPSVVTR
ncbi:MAG: AAA family ATPase [Clostridia bacterium]